MTLMENLVEASSGSPETMAEAALPSVQFPATANQRRYWRDAPQDRSGTALNVSIQRRVVGPLSDAAVAWAAQGVVNRHEILRTRFRESQAGELIQEVIDEIDFAPRIADLRHLPATAREAEAARLTEADARTPFAFNAKTSAAPLFRLLLVRVGSDEAFIQFTFHHLVIDGWSTDLVIRQFCEMVAAYESGSRRPLPPVEMHFGDYALWQKDMLAGPAFEGSRKYWQRKLAGLPSCEIRPDRPLPAADRAGTIRSILLPQDLSEAFERAARASNHTTFSFAAAAVAVALHQITGQSDIVLGSQFAGRDDADSEGIVGPLVNTVVLRLPVSAEHSFSACADRAHDTVLEAMQHQHLPFEEVERIVRGEHADESRPLFSINFTLQRSNIASASAGDESFGAFKLKSMPSHSSGALWDVSLFMVQREEGWRISCEAPQALYDAATIERLLTVWRQVIEACAVRPHAALIGLLASDAPAVSEPPVAKKKAEPKVPVNARVEALKERILPIQPKGNGAPVIAINNVSVFYPVAKAIGQEHPFIDLQFCPTKRAAVPQRHFSDHARDAVEMIRLVRPHGPYALFGLCVCGALAIEAARILRAEGEEVPLVVLNDVYRPGYRERMPFWDRHIRAWQVRWRTFHKLRLRVKSGELTNEQWLANYSILRRLRQLGMLAPFGLRPLDAAAIEALDNGNRWFIEEVLLKSQAQFEMEPYDGRVVLFRTDDAGSGRLFPQDLGWTGYATGDFEIVHCPGTHDTMFRAAGAEAIGTFVRDRLEELEC